MIKLKAVIKETKEIVKVSAIDFGSKHIKVLTENKKYDSSSYTYFRFEEVILLKSTGLYDSKGVEIFEGDIVYYQTHTNWGEAQVVWNEIDARFELMVHSKHFGFETYHIKDLGNLEIIGNIHTKENE